MEAEAGRPGPGSILGELQMVRGGYMGKLGWGSKGVERGSS